MGLGVLEAVKAARNDVEESPAQAGPLTITRSIDLDLVDAILEAVLEQHDPDGRHFEANTAAMTKGGSTPGGSPIVPGAIKTKRRSTIGPKAVTCYNGQRGPSAVFQGFTEPEVDAVLEAAYKGES
jgi:hypothetical protein